MCHWWNLCDLSFQKIFLQNTLAAFECCQLRFLPTCCIYRINQQLLKLTSKRTLHYILVGWPPKYILGEQTIHWFLHHPLTHYTQRCVKSLARGRQLLHTYSMHISIFSILCDKVNDFIMHRASPVFSEKDVLYGWTNEFFIFA